MEYSQKIELVKDYEIRNIILTESNIEVLNKNTICPLCGGGVKTGCFGVSKNKFKCFSCGESGTTIDFIMKITNLDFNETVNYIASKYLNIVDEFKPAKKIEYKPIKKAKKVEPQAETINDKEVNNYFISIVKSLQTTENSKEYDYLLSRGFDEVVCSEYGLNWFSIESYKEISTQLEKQFSIEKLVKAGVYSAKNKLRFFKHRILISYKHKADIQHLQARSLPAETNGSKYLFSGGKTTVFNAHNLNEISKETTKLIFTEGAFDSIAIELLHKRENENIKAVALGSVTFKPKTLKYLIDFCKENKIQPVFGFDNDKAGAVATEKLLSSELMQEMRNKKISFFSLLPVSKDFNNDLINTIKTGAINDNNNFYNIDTEIYLSCLEWLKSLKNYTCYNVDNYHLESLNFISEFDNCKFRFIDNNKRIITLNIN